jgi:hypothetical protein
VFADQNANGVLIMNMKLAMAASALALMCAAPASASVLISDFTIDGATGGLGVSPPYGTVTVNDAGGTLAFSIVLFDDLRFRNAPDDNHFSFAFNLGGLSATIGSITDNGVGTFTQVPGPVNQSPFGSFQYALDCTSGCITGYSATSASQLNFVVTGVGGPLTVSNLTGTSSTYGNVLFAADVANTQGTTGNIGALGGGGGIPEPATWAMMLAGFGGIGAMMRRRRSTSALAV